MKIRTLLTAAVALSGTGLVAARAPSQDATPMISRAVLFGHPDRISPKVSPDGTRLSPRRSPGPIATVRQTLLMVRLGWADPKE